jgi:hypothetical protein
MTDIATIPSPSSPRYSVLDSSTELRQTPQSSLFQYSTSSSDLFTTIKPLNEARSTDNLQSAALTTPPLPTVTRLLSSSTSQGISYVYVSGTVIEIVQFKVQYLLSEITDILINKMTLSIANILGVNGDMLVLSFTEVEMRRRSLLEKGVLVSCSLKNFQGPVERIALQLTQENINSEMQRLGLKSVQVISNNKTTPGDIFFVQENK